MPPIQPNLHWPTRWIFTGFDTYLLPNGVKTGFYKIHPDIKEFWPRVTMCALLSLVQINFKNASNTWTLPLTLRWEHHNFLSESCLYFVAKPCDFKLKSQRPTSHATLLWGCLHHWHCFFGTCFWSGWTLGIFLQHLQTFGLILSWFMHLLWQLFKLPGTSVQFVDFPNQALLLLKSVIFILSHWLGHLLCRSIMPANRLQHIG